MRDALSSLQVPMLVITAQIHRLVAYLALISRYLGAKGGKIVKIGRWGGGKASGTEVKRGKQARS